MIVLTPTAKMNLIRRCVGVTLTRSRPWTSSSKPHSVRPRRLRLRHSAPYPVPTRGAAPDSRTPDLARITSAERRSQPWRLMVAVALAGEDDPAPGLGVGMAGAPVHATGVRLYHPLAQPGAPETGEKPAGTEPRSGGFPMGWVR